MLRLSIPFLFYLFLHHGRVHVGNLSNGELSSDLSRDDGLCARVREGPLDAMDGDGGVAPHVGQQVHLQETQNDRSCRLEADYSDHFQDDTLTLLLYMSWLTPILFL